MAKKNHFMLGFLLGGFSALTVTYFTTSKNSKELKKEVANKANNFKNRILNHSNSEMNNDSMDENLDSQNDIDDIESNINNDNDTLDSNINDFDNIVIDGKSTFNDNPSSTDKKSEQDSEIHDEINLEKEETDNDGSSNSDNLND